MKKVTRFIFLLPFEFLLRIYKAIEKRLPTKWQLWLNQRYLNWGSRLLRHGALYAPGMIIKAPKSHQNKKIVNMYYNFAQNAITYQYKGINVVKRKR